MRHRPKKFHNWVPFIQGKAEKTGEEKFWSSKLHNPLERSFVTVGHLPLPGAEVIRTIYSDNQIVGEPNNFLLLSKNRA